MTTAQIEKRLTAVEEELATLKAQIASAPAHPNNWIEEIAGSFANDPLLEEAVKLGRKWRKSENVKSAKNPQRH